MKKCVLYDDKICDDCGECMRCDLDPTKLCDNCGKCLKKNDDDEFLSIVVHAQDAEALDEFGYLDPDSEEEEELTEEETKIRAILEAPLDLMLPPPIKIDPELQAKWERILADYEEEEKKKEEPDVQLPEIGLHGSRKRRKKDQS